MLTFTGHYECQVLCSTIYKYHLIEFSQPWEVTRCRIPLEVKGQELNPDWSEPKLRSPILFKMARKSEVKKSP